MERLFQSFCEKRFKIDRDLNGGEIKARGEEFFQIFESFYQELQSRGPEKFPFISIKLKRKVEMPVLDGKIDLFEFSKNPEKYNNLFISRRASPVGYVCDGHYGKDMEGDVPALVDSCRGCEYFIEVR
ncbi:MAG: hypothetical protein GTN38_02745 [Candidatus Aenigmarchaeota archaeon]|nr:hypothetical protein [Candidatus Aenigmarchaeota archaeon]NIP40555.1 hypothetical protein [Candidatus Aenigmarchaeota archaeon]NIQ18400.1 hypothetical protein [Candidatus Aenigmarchaeota archaeon]